MSEVLVWVLIGLIIGVVIGAIVFYKKFKWLSKEQVLAIIDQAIETDQKLLESGTLTPEQTVAVKGKIEGLKVIREAIDTGVLKPEALEKAVLAAK